MRTVEPQQPESPNRAKVRNGFHALVRRRSCAAARRRPALLAASAAVFAAQFVLGFALAAQTPAPPAPAPAQPAAHPHKRPSAQKPAVQSVPVPASVAQSAPAPCPDGSPAPVLSPAAPCIPNWPANKKPSEASIVWDSHGLFIQASNSSLDQILKEISLKTGAKVEGMGADERVFGTYGPGPVRDVLTELLEGSGYNILLVGDLGQGTPRRIVLSGRPPGPAQPSRQSSPEADQDQTAPEAPPTGPYAQPEIPGSIPPPPVPARSPQLMQQQQQLMQQRQEQMQQQQQQQQQPNNPQNPQ
ncbi:MAG TPA: hypothetical protein VJX73_11745 [Terracidiphilus sp.]|nr:hypothetical protein [Terracidiphilus sp.]